MRNKNIPIQETSYICASMALVSGFLEAYTFLLKGGVLANAQTGNFAFMGIAIASGEWLKALTYLVPMCFYVVGIFLTDLMPRILDKKGLLKWDTVFVIFEILALGAIAFIPKTVNFMVSTVLISFICAMQYNTFKRTNSMAFSSTFCTNNLRQLSLHLLGYFRTKDRQSLKNSLSYTLINGSFLLGAIVGALAVNLWQEKSILTCCVVLIPVFVALLFGNRE